MAKYTQANQPLAVATPLGPDVLLLERFVGNEAISSLFHFQLDLLASADVEIAFDKLLGQKVTVSLDLASGGKRYWNGIVNRFGQVGRVSSPQKDVFIRYRATLVPQFWLWTKKTQCRVFQNIAVPDILKQVLKGLDFSSEIQGSFPERDYCVQYRESDFAFACRLMEEEGIYWFFKHSDKGHELVLANTSTSHPEVPGASKILFDDAEGGTREEDRIHTWEKYQEVRSGKVTLWDHSFQLPDQNLAANQPIGDAVTVGKVSHKLKVADNDQLELYDYPGGYAHHFDGISVPGEEQPANLQKIFDDNVRVAGIRMQQEAMAGLTTHGESNCRQLTSGHKFTLDRHFNGDGSYVLTKIDHDARLTYLTGGSTEFQYTNRFEAIPLELPFRPARATPKPIIAGAQTATVVVGAPGEQIFCDKYGRVKVQFHWDRLGKSDAHSSCWLRVAQPWAGGGFGAITIPRIGHEVVVAFLEGDPDRPIIVGSVYNAKQMPPYELPKHKTQSGFQTQTQFGEAGNFHGLGFEDVKGGEHVQLHSERHLTQSAEKNMYVNAGQQHITHVGNFSHRLVGGLPGISYGVSTGPSASGSGSGIGKLKRQTVRKRTLANPKGSGGGTGAAYNSAGPFYYSPTWSGVGGSSLDAVFGWRRCDTFGNYSTNTVGQYIANTLSLGGLADLSPSFATSGIGQILSGTLGYVSVVLGTNTLLHYGPSYTVNRGVKWDATDGSPSFACKAIAALYAGLVLVDMFLPLMEPTSTAWHASLGATGAVATDLACGIWLAAEKKDRAAKTLMQSLQELDWSATLVPLQAENAALAAWQTFINQAQAYVAEQEEIDGPGGDSSIAMATSSDAYSINAPVIALVSCPQPTDGSTSSSISIVAQGLEDEGGTVFIAASLNTHITGGAGAYIDLISEEEVGKVTIDCGAAGTMLLQSGLEMEPNFVALEPAGITVSSAELITLMTEENLIVIDPEEGITLTAGESIITLTPEGITLTSGPSVLEIGPEGITLTGPLLTLEADGEMTVAAPAVMIGE